MVLRFEKSCCVRNLLAFFAFTVTTAVVVVEDGGYQNILVTFSPDIPKDDQREVLSETKELVKLASGVVYRATGIHFGEVVLLLPYTWGQLEDWSNFENVTYASANESYYKANIFVENADDTVYGKQPNTLQGGGCGTEGVRMTIPRGFLSSSESTEDDKAKLIAREWIRYRYGVFYENGFSDDDSYPLYYSHPGVSDIHVTGCTDKPVNYTFKNSTEKECTLSVDLSGRPANKTGTCKFRPKDIGNNRDVSSSLMYLQDLPNVVHLCDDQDHIHNSEAPNKQNSLCNGRSIWNVMKDHPDFKNRETTGGTTDAPPEAKFKIIVDEIPRIVLAIDISTSIEDYTKKIVKKATEKLISDLPDETEFSLFRFGSTVQKIYDKISLGTDRPKVTLVFSNKERPRPVSAIKDGLEALTSKNAESKGTMLILSSTDAVDQNNDLSNKLKSSQICLVFILFGSNNSTTGIQKFLKDASPCSRLWIMPPAEKNTALDVLTQMNAEFEDIIRHHSYYNAMFTVETTSVTPSKAGEPISFTTDRSVEVFQIRLASLQDTPLDSLFEDTDVVINNSAGEIYPPTNRMSKFREFVAYEVSTSTNMGLSWNFEITEIDETALKEPILLQVVAKESNSRSLRVRSWVEDTTARESETSEQLPVILYLEVTMGINPVLDAEVQAVIEMPGQATFDTNLLDNGLGDPDVTKNDGIYSRYFTQFTSEGNYNVIFTITDNGSSRTAQPLQSGSFVPCCGSFVPSGTNETTGPFKRVIKTNFRARSGPPPKGYKPSRVQDLLLLSWEDMNLTFKWTAPGNEMDVGTVKEYIFGLFATKQEAEGNFLEKKISRAFTITKPVILGSFSNEQTVEIQLNESLTRDCTYFFAMRSESEKGRQSDTSNVIQIFIPAEIIFTSPPPPTNEAIDGGDDTKTGSRSKTGGVDGKIIGIIVGVCVLVIIICICVYVAFYFIIIRPKRKKNDNDGSPRPHRKSSTTTNRDAGDGTEAADEWQMENNSISPVNSWPSNVLVTHHEKVKEAKLKNQKPPVFTLNQLETSSEKIRTISNGMLSNPIYSSRAEDLNGNHDHETHTSLPLQDNSTARPNKRVTHV